MKRGQITVFIILGIVVLSLAAGVIYIRNNVAETVTDASLDEVIEVIPDEALPVKLYVESKLDLLVKDALDLALGQGGHIRTTSFTNNFNPTDAEHLEFTPGYKVPYWHYLASANDCTNCQFGSQMKPLCKEGRDCVTKGAGSIEESFEEFILAEIDAAIGNFDPITRPGLEIAKTGDPEVTIAIRDEDIVATLLYPLEVTAGATTDVTRFRVIIPTALTELYSMGKELVEYQQEGCYLEEHTRHYYSRFQGLEDNDIPPQMKNAPSSLHKVWALPTVKEQLKQHTASAMQALTVTNTSENEALFFPDPTDPNYDIRQEELDKMVARPFSEYHDDTLVSFMYLPTWDTYLDITPSDSGILTPKRAGIGLPGPLGSIASSIIRENIYEFNYQYSYPVAIQIRKYHNDRTETLTLAVEGNIRGNQCLRSGMTVAQPDPLFPSLTCSDAERTVPIVVTVRDEETGEPLPDVEVSFDSDESCFIGVTDANGNLQTKIPDVFGGFVVLSKEGYLSQNIHDSRFDTSINTGLMKIKQKGVTFRMIAIDDIDRTFPNQIEMDNFIENRWQSVGPDDALTLTLTRKGTPDDAVFETEIAINQGLATAENISIVPGLYDVDISYNLGSFDLPEERDQICVKSGPLNTCNKKPVHELCQDTDFETTRNPHCYLHGYTCEGTGPGANCATDEPIVYEANTYELMPMGGAIFEWTVPDYTTLNQGNTIEFRFFQNKVPQRFIDLSQDGRHEEFSTSYRFIIEPTIS